MTLAKMPPHLEQFEVEKLVVVDIAPTATPLSSDIHRFIKSMRQVNQMGGMEKRSQIDAFLSTEIPVIPLL